MLRPHPSHAVIAPSHPHLTTTRAGRLLMTRPIFSPCVSANWLWSPRRWWRSCSPASMACTALAWRTSSAWITLRIACRLVPVPFLPSNPPAHITNMRGHAYGCAHPHCTCTHTHTCALSHTHIHTHTRTHIRTRTYAGTRTLAHMHKHSLAAVMLVVRSYHYRCCCC